MTKVEELIQYFNNTYGLEKEWPKTFEVSAELYGRCCQYVFNHWLENYVFTLIPGVGYRLDIDVGQHGGIMFKNVELMIKKEQPKSNKGWSAGEG